MRWLMLVCVGLAMVVIAVVLTLVLLPGPSEDHGTVDGPVVAEPTRAAYPIALVRGNLSLDGDCLMLGPAVVFWPAGTSWDPESESVVFAGDFDGAVSVPVGSHFVGGGGVFASSDDFLGGLGEAGEVLRDCVASTSAPGLVLAYPDFPG